MNATANAVARERQLDWLLEEALGGERGAAPRVRATSGWWRAAAIAVFALGVAVGVAVLREGERQQAAQDQEPAPAMLECHGAAGLAKLPADVRAVRCFDFDDAACAQLAKFVRLEHLDLSGRDVDERGVSRMLAITDAGVKALAPLVALRRLCLADCEHVRGAGLRWLEAMPRLEHLDLTHTGVQTLAVERLARLPSLRSLSLSHCQDFHGRALAAIAKLPGLRTLQLQGCVTLAAKDVLVLAQLTELRHLDLRDCQGRYRGQTAAYDAPASAANADPKPGDPSDPGAGEAAASAPSRFLDTDGDGLPDTVEPPPPVQDGIGITPEVVAALATLPLETLRLGGSESLTDAIGSSLAKMIRLRELDLSGLRKIHDPTLRELPASIERLSLRNSGQLRVTALPPLPRLRALDVTGLSLSATDLQQVLAGRAIEDLALGVFVSGDIAVETLREDAVDVLCAVKGLRRLRLSRCSWVDAGALTRIAALEGLRELDLGDSPALRDPAIAALGMSRSLHALRLNACRGVDGSALRSLDRVPLHELDLYGTSCDPALVRELAAKHWPGCLVTLPSGAKFRAP